MRWLVRQVKMVMAMGWYLAMVLGRLVRRMVGGQPRPVFVVLYYHAVPSNRAVQFERQIAAICRRSAVLPAGSCDVARNHGVNIAITFDDAFRSVMEVAHPILAKYGCTATVFVPVAWAGRSPGWEMELGCPDRDEQVMSLDEMRCLDRGVFRLGSHTMTHPRLPSCDDESLRSELRESLGAVRGLPSGVAELACPYGAFDDRVVRVAKELGYERVFSISPSSVAHDGRDFVRGRVAVKWEDSALEFFLKSQGAYDVIHRLKRLVRPSQAGGFER